LVHDGFPFFGFSYVRCPDWKMLQKRRANMRMLALFQESPLVLDATASQNPVVFAALDFQELN
jgi:hypothetical protein